jgi:predicted dehydrogenase
MEDIVNAIQADRKPLTTEEDILIVLKIVEAATSSHKKEKR